jgi:penicillin-binding protein 2B
MVAYEPGSVMKTFTWAIGLDANPDFKLENTFNGNTYYLGAAGDGNIKRVASPSSPGYVSTIWNFAKWQYGETNYWDAFRLSINAGALSILEQYLTKEIYVEYLHKFNFFKPVNVFGIENESEGIENLDHVYDLGPSTFGQACGYTALQVMQGYTAFCNDGYMVKPYIVDKIVNRYTGETVYQGQTEIVGHPIKAETAKLVQALMKQTNTSYANPNLSVGGKTGTAQVAENGRYGNQWVHSIVLTMPADDPKILVYVCYQDYSAYGHNQSFVQDLEQTIAEQYNMSTTNLTPENPDKQIFEDAMPNLVNHSLEYVNRKLAACQANITFIGTGPTVIAQYPEEGSTIITGQTVMLLLNRETITMPDMRGWSRKEVTAFWELTGIEITLDGSGYVTEQSIDVGENIGVGSQIYVKLE